MVYTERMEIPMAQHDLTDLVTRIEAIGGDINQLLALADVERAGRNVTGIPAVFAWNRKAYAAAHDLVEGMERRAPQSAKPVIPAPAEIPLATATQVSYATALIRKRISSGEEGGFMSGRYPTGDQLAAMTRRDISALIGDMKSAYDY